MYRVLIVEDDPMVAMINEQYVCKNKDFTVVKSCRNGQEALDFLMGKDSGAGGDATGAMGGACGGAAGGACGTEGVRGADAKIDLIIMDVFMPYMDGIETLKKIREEKIDSEVIMVTAANDAATLEETMHLGVIDFLIKPFAYERFQIALEKFAAKKEALRQTSGVIDQNYVDNLISGKTSAGGSPSLQKNVELPKGIQQKTLNLITAYMSKKDGWISGDKIADDVGLSLVTIRHYMNYLVDIGKVRADINYETGGRPSVLYSVK